MRLDSIPNKILDLLDTVHKKPLPIKKPIVIQFPINDICNAKCQMCNIWQQKLDYQIMPNELSIVLDNPLFSEVRSVGMNGGEPTLRKDISEFGDILFQKLPKLKGISLITNALNSKQAIKRIKMLGSVVRSHNGNLDVMVSLDGVGDVHDKVRGRSGNFENAVKVIDFAQSSDLVTTTQIACTVIRENIYGIHDLLDFAVEKNIYVKFRIGVPHQRLYSSNLTHPFGLSFEEKYHFAVFLENLIKYYETSTRQTYFYKSLIGQLIYNKPRIAGCDWQHRGVTLTARGEILYCAVESKTLGSGVTQDAESLYFGNESHLHEIIETKCDTCMHDYVGLPPTNILIKEYFERLGLRTFKELIRKNRTMPYFRKLRHKKIFEDRISDMQVSSLPKLTPATRLPKQKSQTDQYKVLIVGWYGTETLGDKAILGGVISGLQASLHNLEIHIASLEPYISQITAEQMPELYQANIHSINTAFSLVPEMDLVVMGGGPLMAMLTLTEVLNIFRKASTCGIPTLIAGCGVGPLGHDFYNNAIREILQLASGRIYRDEESLTLAASLGINTSDDLVAEDPAFTWLATHLNRSIVSQDEQRPDSPTLLLGLRDWPYREYASQLSETDGKEIKDQFEYAVIMALEKLILNMPHLRIIPFPMCTNHIGNDDRWFYRRLFRASKIKKNIDYSYLSGEVTPEEAISVFRDATASLTMRFHSLVFALATQSKLTTVAIDYTMGQGKVHSIASKANIPYMPIDKVSSDFIVSSLKPILEGSKNVDKQAFNDLSFVPAMTRFISFLRRD